MVLATGVFGVPHRPEIPGAADFTGRLLHATEYTGGVPAAGVRALVVGSGSSAHDVAQDLYEAGAQVTMLQRSSTCVVSLEPGAARAYSIYREDGAPTEDCDLVNNSFPLPLLAELHKDMTGRIAQMDDTLLRGLRAAGFQLDFGEDGSGFLMKYHRTGGGYYINVGCSDLIVAGKIKVKHGAEIAGLDGRTVRFTDGTTMDTDMIVVATGYQNMSESVRALFGDDVAARVGPVWGLDGEGEVRAMWRRTGQPGLWIMGGSLQQCRPYSKYLALQIKGGQEGLVPLAGDARAEAVEHHLGERPADLGRGRHAAGSLAVPAVRPVDHADDAVGDHPGRSHRADRAVPETGLDDPDDRVVVPLVDHRHLPGPGGPAVGDLAEVLLDVHEQVGIVGGVRRHQRGDQEPQLVHRGSWAVPDRLGLLGVGLGGVPDDLVEEFFFAADVVVERRPVGAQALRHVGEAGAPEPLLAEDPGGRRDDLGPALSVGRAALGEGGSSSAADTALHSHVPFLCRAAPPAAGGTGAAQYG